MSDKKVKWECFFDPSGEIGGIQDSTGRMVVKFNYHDLPQVRAALAKNILWVAGCIKSDIKYNKYGWRERWHKLWGK